MAGPYEHLCHYSLTSLDPLLEETLLYLLTCFPSHVFDYTDYEGSDNESVDSNNSPILALYPDESTFFSRFLPPNL